MAGRDGVVSLRGSQQDMSQKQKSHILDESGYVMLVEFGFAVADKHLMVEKAAR